MQIAKLLTADKILPVKAHYAKRDGKTLSDNLYRWDYKSVAGILKRPEYRDVRSISIFKRIYEDDITGAISHERFLKLSAEYEAEQKELTPTIVNEFVKKIIVHAPDKSSGHRRQKIQIVWNFIGELEQDNDTQTAPRQRKSRTA